MIHETIARKADVVLRGHLHAQRSVTLFDPDSMSIELAGGCIYDGSEYANGCAVRLARPTGHRDGAYNDQLPLPRGIGTTSFRSTSPSKCRTTRSATERDRIRSPTSMFLSWAASVKFADDTNAISLSTATHLACRQALLRGSLSSDRG